MRNWFTPLRRTLLYLIFLLRLFMARMGNSFAWLLYRSQRKCFGICRCRTLSTSRAIKGFSVRQFLLILISGSSLSPSNALPNCMTSSTSSDCPKLYFSVLVLWGPSMQPPWPIFTHLLVPYPLVFGLLFGHFSILKGSSKPNFIFMLKSSHLERQILMEFKFTWDLLRCSHTYL